MVLQVFWDSAEAWRGSVCLDCFHYTESVSFPGTFLESVTFQASIKTTHLEEKGIPQV